MLAPLARVGTDRTFRKIKWKLKLIWETSFLEISAEIKLYSRTFQGEYKDERGGAWAVGRISVARVRGKG